MKIKEYRIPMPCSVEEYRIAQLYMVARYSLGVTNKGEGVVFAENTPYEKEDGEKGQFTHKIIQLGSHLPGWIRAITPTSLLTVHEKCWNSYPNAMTTYSCEFFGDRFSMSIQSKYLPDNGTSENPFSLEGDELALREIDIIDIRNDPIDPKKYKKEFDPMVFKSKKTERGKLTEEWRQSHSPIMSSYKLCKVNFQIWGLQTRIENFVHNFGLRSTFLNSHRECFAWIDEWFDMTIEDIRKMEEDIKSQLISKMSLDDLPN